MLTKIYFLITISHTSQFTNNILKERLEIKSLCLVFCLGLNRSFAADSDENLVSMRTICSPCENFLHTLFDNVKLIDLYDSIRQHKREKLD